jgi:hypothetical protein
VSGELREFEIPWFQNGRWRSVVVRSDSYPKACYELGLRMAEKFKKFGVPADLQVNLGGPGVCNVCGCTETNCRHCIERTGEPCSWANEERTVCTACVGRMAFSISLGQL